MLPWLQVFLDTPRAAFDEAVDFWSAVTGWRPSERRGEDDQFLTLVPPGGSAYVKMQAVDGPAGVHLDLDSVDRPASIDQARSLGATTAWVYHDVEVMRSPGLTGRELQQATAPGFSRLVAPDQPRILLQRLGDPTGTVHAHPDLASSDRGSDTVRHQSLGATVVGVHPFWTVLSAPGGQVYCLTDRDPRTGVVRQV